MGMIVAAHDVAGIDQETLGVLDVTVRRNAFGRQIASAEVPLAIDALGEPRLSRRVHSRAVDRARRAGRRGARQLRANTPFSCGRGT